MSKATEAKIQVQRDFPQRLELIEGSEIPCLILEIKYGTYDQEALLVLKSLDSRVPIA